MKLLHLNAILDSRKKFFSKQTCLL
jgi:hypothetical protein